MTQPNLIDQIGGGIGLSTKSPDKFTPATLTVILTADPTGAPFPYQFEKLNFLEKSMCPGSCGKLDFFPQVTCTLLKSSSIK